MLTNNTHHPHVAATVTKNSHTSLQYLLLTNPIHTSPNPNPHLLTSSQPSVCPTTPKRLRLADPRARPPPHLQVPTSNERQRVSIPQTQTQSRKSTPSHANTVETLNATPRVQKRGTYRCRLQVVQAPDQATSTSSSQLRADQPRSSQASKQS